MQLHTKGYLCGLGAVIIWTGFIVVSRMGGISALFANDIIAIRYATCAVLLLPLWWFKYRVNLLDPKILLISTIGGIGYASCAFRGFSLAPASHAAVLLPGLMPLFITLLSTLLLKEKPSLLKWFGIIIITIGALTLLTQGTGADSDVGAGQAWLIAATICWSLFSVLVKRWNISPWEAVISVAIISSIIYLPTYALFLSSNIAETPWQDIAIQVVYQGFLATIVQLVLYVRAMHIIGASSMGTLMALVPMLAGIAAVFLLDEPFGAPLAIGILLVSAGSIATQRTNNKQTIPSVPPAPSRS
ncbi:hypothetical protein A9Q99_01110 [Gammaproteobacteria bacterium 45_16_T64]|nr:hypothetical protein A9Q99_01110 [Gammaproteobacteria bacterium 45_16_T64]